MSSVPPPVITTVPLAGSVVEMTVFGPASGSVSLASTSIAVGGAVLGHGGGVVDRGRVVGTQVTVTETVAVEPPLRV